MSDREMSSIAKIVLFACMYAFMAASMIFYAVSFA